MSSPSTSAMLYSATVNPTAIFGAVPDDAKDKKHHLKDHKGFTNPWNSFGKAEADAVPLKMARRHISGNAHSPNTTPPTIPVHKPNFPSSRLTPTLRATWLGHACYYVEFPDGFRALFDPVFSERCSPFSWLGPKRYTEAPCQVEDIPAYPLVIDAVFISHNHYDHMDHPTLTKIAKLHPNAHFFAPLGNKQWFIASGINNVTELDWWEECGLELSLNNQNAEARTDGDIKSSGEGNDPTEISAKIGCLPAQHMSSRSLLDRNKTLWASWSVESGGKKVWFAGDTGYRTIPESTSTTPPTPQPSDLPTCPAFCSIGANRGPFDLGLIPIGAYEPRYIFSPMHADPFDAVDIFLDTKCKRAMAIHWGTWVLTEEEVLEPPRLLKEALKAKDIKAEGVFDVCDIGQSTLFE
ncbi:MAG: hypothetical protein M1834_006812 [Cirrosporium novae-zelandiae]|nr:MAG: hypothetical protein M1834_006812 [Cirrosporium novae-zelandiae]